MRGSLRTPGGSEPEEQLDHILQHVLEEPEQCESSRQEGGGKWAGEISPEYSLGGLMLKLKLPILWPPDNKNRLIGKDPDSGED